VDLTGELIARVSGGRLASGDGTRPIAGVSIDSRTLQPGELFVAIRGPRFDGHAFAGAALDRGASGILVDAADAVSVAAARGRLAIVVTDTVAALQRLARHVRRASGARVVAVTGSTGKTTTKEWAAELLAARYRVARSRGNLNNQIGLPLALIELRDEPEVAVVELAMNHPGEIRTLVGIAEPDVRVWTNVGDAHLGAFASIDALARAKAEILESAAPETVLVANADDPRVMTHAAHFAGRLVTFGTGRADVCARDIVDRGLEGLRVRVATPAGEVTLETALVGAAGLANLLAAVAVAVVLDVPLAAIAARARALRPAPHRGEVVALARGVTLLDDSYNASPAAVAAVLDVVATAARHRRCVAFLGEMLELGAHAVALHEQTGRRAAAAGLSALVTIGGPPARALADAAVAAGLPPTAVHHVATSDEAAALVPAVVQPGDLVLVKGSRAVGTERVVERVTQEFA
jgi:UDP-N-acetylmuramoyl-tripeptide--D-alanyl-D-alanine ligase